MNAWIVIEPNTISVIIPCYNSEGHVQRAIDSVLAQTVPVHEILAVDNGSTDGTLEILNAYARKHPALIKVLQEPKKGAPAARNKGLHEAKGAWLQFLDADDELLPEKLQTQMKRAAQTKGDVIVGEIKVIINGKEYRRYDGIETGNIWKGLLISRLGRTSSFLWRRSAVLAVSGWNEAQTSSQEYELLFRMLQQNDTVAFCPVPHTLVYRRNDSIHASIDSRRAIEIAENHLNLRFAIRDYLKAKNRLTTELAYAMNAHLFLYLVKMRAQAPEYAAQKLKKVKPELPVSFFVTRYAKATRLKLTAFVKRRLGVKTSR